MKIVCVSWGSLLWNLKGFPVAGDWHYDGPELPLEYARHSDGEIASLVLMEGGPAVPTFWAPVVPTTVDEAREALRQREDVRRNANAWIGSIPGPAGVQYLHADVIGRWLERNGADAVVWTALPPKSRNENGRVPSLDEAVAYMRSLADDDLQRAETYVRRTPLQIRTPFRDRFEAEFGWTPLVPATEQ
jgi:hypothetical protein